MMAYFRYIGFFLGPPEHVPKGSKYQHHTSKQIPLKFNPCQNYLKDLLVVFPGSELSTDVPSTLRDAAY